MDGLVVVVVPPGVVPPGVLVLVFVGVKVKSAVTVLLAPSVKEQVEAVPEHAPPHPAKVEPVVGVAVRVTWVPGAPVEVQDVPQLMAPADVTVP
jgi:hypothetical protein